MIKCLVDGEEIFLYDGGTAVRDYIYVDDVCGAIMHCLYNSPNDEIINIGSGKPTVLKDIVAIAQQFSNSTSKVNIIEPPHFHKVVQVRDAYLDNSKLTSYGYSIRYSTEDMVKKLVTHYKNSKV